MKLLPMAGSTNGLDHQRLRVLASGGKSRKMKLQRYRRGYRDSYTSVSGRKIKDGVRTHLEKEVSLSLSLIWILNYTLT